MIMVMISIADSCGGFLRSWRKSASSHERSTQFKENVIVPTRRKNINDGLLTSGS
jgi:hypothetical protein